MFPILEALGLDNLSVEDKLALAEALWDSAAHDVETAPILPSQLAELKRRLADSIANPDDVVPWEEVKARSYDSQEIAARGIPETVAHAARV